MHIHTYQHNMVQPSSRNLQLKCQHLCKGTHTQIILCFSVCENQLYSKTSDNLIQHWNLWIPHPLHARAHTCTHTIQMCRKGNTALTLIPDRFPDLFLDSLSRPFLLNTFLGLGSILSNFIGLTTTVHCTSVPL